MISIRTCLPRLLACGIIGIAMNTAAYAHFIFTVTEPAEHPQQVKVYFSEDASPDNPEYLSKISHSKVWILDGRGEDPQSISLSLKDDALVGEIPRKLSSQPVVLQCDYGVLSRGDAPFVLKYYAKTYPSALPGTWNAVDNKELLPFEITPSVGENGLMLHVTWEGKPLARSQVTVEGPGLKDKIQGDTDEKGQFTCQLNHSGLFSIRARHIDETAGERDGKKFQSTKHYSTLALRFEPARITPVADQWPTMAHGTTSFGAGVVGNDLYVYGGHYGQAHHYSREGQSGDFQRLNLKDGKAWEALPGGPKLTGLAMVAYDGQLYRVGGFVADNNDDEEEKLISRPDFARFNPKAGKWEELTPLPEGRSSHDAVLLGETLYVIGGWEMKKTGDDQEHNWLKTAWSCDLSQKELTWQPVPAPPFERRAISLAAHQGKIYSIGGMQKKGGPTTQVSVYDPATKTWAKGPSILGTSMDGFGTASFGVDGQLVTTTMSGSIQGLSKDGQSWEYLGQMAHPRFFHEMVPWQHNLIVVGGASMRSGKIDGLERLPLNVNETTDQKAALK